MMRVLPVASSMLFLAAGAIKITESFRNRKTAEEILDFCHMVKDEIRFRSLPFDELLRIGEKRNYRYLVFQNGSIALKNSFPEEVRFCDFVSSIGTTDESGQIDICERYGEAFKEMVEKYREEARQKSKVWGAVSGLLAVSCFMIN